MANVMGKDQVEYRRLTALRRLQVVDSTFETVFDEIVRIASVVCNTPIALITMVEQDHQFFLANVGMPNIKTTPKEGAFCANCILLGGVMEVPDASIDPRFADHPFVKQSPSIRFYGGAPVKLPMGENIGTLCVIDYKTGSLTDIQKTVLSGLANLVAKILVSRRMMLDDIKR